MVHWVAQTWIRLKRLSMHSHIYFLNVYTYTYEQYIIYLYAAAAKSLQLCPTLCDPIDGNPLRLPKPWDSPGKNTGVGCHFLLQYIYIKVYKYICL